MRKVQEKRNALELDHRKRDIITDYANTGSQMYAPLARSGQHKHTGESYEVPILLRTTEGLQRIQPNDKQKAKTLASSSFSTSALRNRALDRQLAISYERIQEKKAILREVELKGVDKVREEEMEKLRFLQKVERPKDRAATPELVDE